MNKYVTCETVISSSCDIVAIARTKPSTVEQKQNHPSKNEELFMPMIPWGAGSKGNVKIPTYTAWLKENQVESTEYFQVVKITKSQKYGGYMMTCAAPPTKGFYVILGENNDEYEEFPTLLKELIGKKEVLYVNFTDVEWGHWQFTTNNERTGEWEKTGSGYTCKTLEQVKENVTNDT